MGNITIQGDLTGDVPGGEVGGASNLTTVGAIPYVSAAGILNQDPTALFWDATNKRLGVGTNAPGYALDVSGNLIGNHVLSINNLNVAGKAYARYSVASDSVVMTQGVTPTYAFFWMETAHPMLFATNGVERARFTAFTGNLLIGTATDSNFKLDVAASGSAGTARFYGGSGVSNSTKVVVQAGGGQSGNLQEWQNSAGTVTASISADGAELVVASNIYAGTYAGFSSGELALTLRDTARVSFSQDSTRFGTKDTGIGRNSAGVLEVNNGTAGTYRDLILRRSQHNGVTVADLPAAAAGNAGSIQYVTDANATTIGSTVAGGGANKVMVWSDGAAWKIFAS